ncbi:hypothetical protein cyc_00351 [Cyclospora cayetanensis]|uniref:Uncharacterized protein n=1 Tax=Cyclospora cayetanensis TaxID=88456 RepID=A0A1D3D449_9EIME|nr:hypothetical protein cyc_00351 [Cyclospora cayetanensis]
MRIIFRHTLLPLGAAVCLFSHVSDPAALVAAGGRTPETEPSGSTPAEDNPRFLDMRERASQRLEQAVRPVWAFWKDLALEDDEDGPVRDEGLSYFLRRQGRSHGREQVARPELQDSDYDSDTGDYDYVGGPAEEQSFMAATDNDEEGQHLSNDLPGNAQAQADPQGASGERLAADSAQTSTSGAGAARMQQGGRSAEGLTENGDYDQDEKDEPTSSTGSTLREIIVQDGQSLSLLSFKVKDQGKAILVSFYSAWSLHVDVHGNVDEGELIELLVTAVADACLRAEGTQEGVYEDQLSALDGKVDVNVECVVNPPKEHPLEGSQDVWETEDNDDSESTSSTQAAEEAHEEEAQAPADIARSQASRAAALPNETQEDAEEDNVEASQPQAANVPAHIDVIAAAESFRSEAVAVFLRLAENPAIPLQSHLAAADALVNFAKELVTSAFPSA